MFLCGSDHSWNNMYMLILNFTYPLRCLRVPPGVRVPPVEYHWSKATVRSISNNSYVYALCNRGSIPGRTKIITSISAPGPTSHPPDGHIGLFSGSKSREPEANHSPQSNAEVFSVNIYLHAPTFLHGIMFRKRGNLYLTCCVISQLPQRLFFTVLKYYSAGERESPFPFM
jgi:hypothetical protein